MLTTDVNSFSCDNEAVKAAYPYILTAKRSSFVYSGDSDSVTNRLKKELKASSITLYDVFSD